MSFCHGMEAGDDEARAVALGFLLRQREKDKAELALLEARLAVLDAEAVALERACFAWDTILKFEADRKAEGESPER